MQNSNALNPSPAPSSKRGIWQTVLLVVVISAITSVLTVWLTALTLFPREFKPVTLDAGEKKVLAAKIDRLDQTRPRPVTPSSPQKPVRRSSSDHQSADTLEPEAYSEESARREITFTERELNALLATNTDLARKLAVDLSENLASAKLLVPLDPDLPFFGGKTLKVSAGLELRFADGRPVVALRGVSLWGVPIPNAWLGGIKNLDLVKEFGSQGGFWKVFAAGVENIRVEEGQVTVRLRE